MGVVHNQQACSSEIAKVSTEGRQHQRGSTSYMNRANKNYCFREWMESPLSLGLWTLVG